MASRKHRLCRTCATRFDNPETEDFKYNGSHHENYVEIERSADRGCYICVRIRLKIQTSLGDRNTRPLLKSCEYRVCPTHDLREWTLKFDIQMSHLGVAVDFLVLNHLQYPLEDSHCNIPPNTLNPECMTLARSWLRNCRERHTCQTICPSTIQGVYPTRLLHIQQSRDGAQAVRLVYPHNLTEHVEYLTLSHMWGDQKFLKLTIHNHNSLLKLVSPELLSQTFRDALHVTLELGYEYLWIDSLCIVQDDEQDWKNESERMALIYKNAVCNLCASGSATKKAGLLSEVRAVDPLPPLIHFDGDLPNRTKSLSEIEPWTWLRDSPLYQRAWVLQEQILAARAIHFGSDQMHWECAEIYANEVWPRGWPATEVNQLGPAKHPFYRRFLPSQHDKVAWHITVDPNHKDLTNPLGQNLTWTKIIEDYSYRKLTYSTDRLPALAGLITQFTQLDKTMGKCVAGIWEDHLHNQLYWRKRIIKSTSSETSYVRPDWSRVPSWSWASINAPVQWHVHSVDTKEQLCKISVNHGLCYDLPSLYAHGTLLKLSLADCELRVTDGGPKNLGFQLHNLPLSCHLDLDPWFLEETLDFEADEHDIYEHIVCSITIFPVLWYLHEVHAVKCLLLWRDPNLADGVYRRAGVMTIQEQERDCLKYSYAKLDFIREFHAYTVEEVGIQETEYIEAYRDGTCLIEIR